MILYDVPHCKPLEELISQGQKTFIGTEAKIKVNVHTLFYEYQTTDNARTNLIL